MRIRAILIAGTIAVGGLTGVAAEAHASKPRIGNYCTKSEVSNIQRTENGHWTVCVYMGSGGGYKWVATAKVDPVVRKLGQRCTGKYPVARTPRGKAVMCVQGKWTYGP
ncbi:hypothetical protein [Gordonia sp. (in: high G+C Gram-positive bacteria)]|jgi:hypothetical protein|uniref:hypothetical protein n=1 Tax=Gordonia sp. (in: high G+C Gram-positive bacteria) TaxID=84139 RepID=UPI001E049BA7|nr:hypothetical protein [Gordonia sp. (in: high G+C Gram-positive bacteria)]MCB1297170.1 hypothetical protein [Gordonia sp. (in: high G+C Gram-positive bacteria)]HQV18488.1 hypothetical protein [Gordonia sp. (in: high G+C Gram-positive bacteria)]